MVQYLFDSLNGMVFTTTCTAHTQKPVTDKIVFNVLVKVPLKFRSMNSQLDQN